MNGDNEFEGYARRRPPAWRIAYGVTQGGRSVKHGVVFAGACMRDCGFTFWRVGRLILIVVLNDAYQKSCVSTYSSMHRVMTLLCGYILSRVGTATRFCCFDACISEHVFCVCNNYHAQGNDLVVVASFFGAVYLALRGHNVKPC